MVYATPSKDSLIRRFRREDDGAVTVAAVLWLPFFVFVLTLVFDVAMIFYGQAQAQQVAEDVNRSLSVGAISSSGEAETLARTSLYKLSPNASASTSTEDFMIRTVVRMPSSDLAGVGVFSSIANFEITAVAHMVLEF